MRIAILGGGQLAWMMAQAAEPLGLDIRVLDPSSEAPAGRVAHLVVGAYDDPSALDRVSAGADVVTYEFENVPGAAVARLVEGGHQVLPFPASLTVAQDRLKEKELIQRVGVRVASHLAIDSEDDVEGAVAAVGLPGILKTRRLGYDGKGQVRVADAGSLLAAVRELGGTDLIYEGLVDFRRELSVVLARATDGRIASYPPVANRHRGGILEVTEAPAPDLDPAVASEALEAAAKVAEALDHVGVLCLELFETADGIVANEIAPRVHNSGHWTIEGAVTSQFENHLRAVAGLPLGDASPIGVSAMVNLVGGVPDLVEMLAVPGAGVHLYGKEPRPGRKLGHVTVTAPDAAALAAPLARLHALADAAWDA